jgi:cation diffusion facilitator family transporter
MAAHRGYEDGERGSVVSVVVNGGLFLFKIFAGIVGHSNAMIADALDTLGDVMTSSGMIVGFRIARRPPDPHHPYGHGKAESIIAKLLAIFLIGLGLKVAYNALHIIFISHAWYIPGKIALVAAVVSILVKMALFNYTYLLGKRISSTAMTVYSWNIACDVLSSTAALIGIAGARFGFRMMDPIAAFVLSFFIIKAGADGFHRAYDELMDGAPSKAVIEGLREIALECEGTKAVKDIKVRKMGLDLMIDMTIGVAGDISVEKGHSIAEAIRTGILNKVQTAKEVFIHVEPFGR